MKELIDQLNTDFVEFKKKNDELMDQKIKGAVDGLLKEQVEKMSASIAETQSKVDGAIKAAEEAQLAAKRRYETEKGGEVMTEEQKKRRELWSQYLRGRLGERPTPEILQLMAGGSQKHAMSSYSDAAGGYLVMPELDRDITKFLYDTSPIRQVARTVRISTDQYEKPQRRGRAGFNWRNRETAGGETTAPTYGKVTIKVHDLEARPLVPVNLINDAYVDVEPEVRDAVGTEFSLAENSAFVIGDGDGQPRGFLDYPAGTDPTLGQVQQVNSGSAAALTSDGIHSLVTALKSAYRARAVFGANRTTIGSIMKMKDGQNNYLWQPSFMAGRPQTLVGYPIQEMNDIPSEGANALALVFGDFFSGYTIVDRIGITILVDPFTSKGNIEYYTNKRVGGGVDNFEAIKIQKCSV